MYLDTTYTLMVRVTTKNVEKDFPDLDTNFPDNFWEVLPAAWNDNRDIFQMKITTYFDFTIIGI